MYINSGKLSEIARDPLIERVSQVLGTTTDAIASMITRKAPSEKQEGITGVQGLVIIRVDKSL